jgi:predicted RNase H-like HicB family nuclease
MADRVSRYRVVYELDESGHWIVTAPDVKGCHTYGRSLAQARARIREALGLFIRDSARASFTEEIRLPANMRSLVEKFRVARERAEKDRRQADEAARKLAKRVSRRDAAELLNLSHQRIQQIAEA